MTVVRPTTLTLLRGPANTGAHVQPLVAASQAEKHKHRLYDTECAKQGWKLVPFALESLGAKGSEATQLLQRMSAHAIDMSPTAFLTHADRMLSLALQVGNAHISNQGTADMLLQSYRAGVSGENCIPLAGGVGRAGAGAGHHQMRRTASALREEMMVDGFGPIVHADYRAARMGVRAVAVAA